LGHPIPPMLASYPLAFARGPFATPLVHLPGRHPLWFGAGGSRAGGVAFRGSWNRAPSISGDTPPTAMAQRYLLLNVVALAQRYLLLNVVVLAQLLIAALTSNDQFNALHPNGALALISYQAGGGVNGAPLGGVRRP